VGGVFLDPSEAKGSPGRISPWRSRTPIGCSISGIAILHGAADPQSRPASACKQRLQGNRPFRCRTAKANEPELDALAASNSRVCEWLWLRPFCSLPWSDAGHGPKALGGNSGASLALKLLQHASDGAILAVFDLGVCGPLSARISPRPTIAFALRCEAAILNRAVVYNQYCQVLGGLSACGSRIHVELVVQPLHYDATRAPTGRGWRSRLEPSVCC